MNKTYDEILAMKHGEYKYFNSSEDGGAEIQKSYDYYFLFEIPQYGGEPRFIRAYPKNRIIEMIKEFKSWT